MTDLRAVDDVALAAGASLSPNAGNEDAVVVAYNTELALTSVVVADGVGSAIRAGEASRFLVARFAEVLEHATAPLELVTTYARLHDALNAHARLVATEEELGQNLLASTLISAIEYQRHFDVAYLGNGGIWHARGNFDQFRDTQYLPWNAINYLNPHTNQDGMGRESLYKSFAAGAAQQDVVPTTLRLSKDDRYGDILMVCTDGVYSFDQVRIGRVATDNSIWISGEPLMLRFFATLKAFFAGPELTSQALTGALERYLADARAEHLLDDDSTIAVLISAAAVRFHRQRAAELRK